jgi:hypothetical protein
MGNLRIKIRNSHHRRVAAARKRLLSHYDERKNMKKNVVGLKHDEVTL